MRPSGATKANNCYMLRKQFLTNEELFKLSTDARTAIVSDGEWYSVGPQVASERLRMSRN